MAGPLTHGCAAKTGKKQRYGWLHTYQSKRDLNGLVLDVESSAVSGSQGAGAGGEDPFYLLTLGVDEQDDHDLEEKYNAKEGA